MCLFYLVGAGGVGGLDQGEELHSGRSGLWQGPEQRAEVTTKTQDSGWRTAGSPVTAAGVLVFLFVRVRISTWDTDSTSCVCSELHVLQ